MKIATLFAGLLLIALACMAGTAGADDTGGGQRRVALVIANAAYAHGGRLSNPPNDAAAVAASLRQAGFTVELHDDLGRVQLEDALKAFTRAAAGADVALVYYAGHGIEHGGTNYLIPVDATLAADTDIDFEAVPLDLVMHSVGGATRLKIVILDACRDNPFRDAMRRSAGTRGIGMGLAKPPDPEEGDMLVAYAAAAGSTAEDGAGGDSPFATALAKHLTDPGVDVRIMFGRIRDDVRTATQMRQEPTVYESLGGEQFYMTAAVAAPAASPVARAPAVSTDAKAMELAYWQSVQASGDAGQLGAYLKRYPNGTFADVAKAKIAALSRPRAAIAIASSSPEAAPAITRDTIVGGGRLPTEGPAGRYDGRWRVRQSCDNTPPGVRLEFEAQVASGRLHGLRGEMDRPGWLALDGRVSPDGAAQLRSHGVNRHPDGSEGLPFDNPLTGQFSDDRGIARGAMGHTCTFAFTRE
jgi:hypothetical protein